MASSYRYYGPRSGWDNFADFLNNFLGTYQQTSERTRMREQEDLDRKIRFQAQDPALQESLRKVMSPEEQVKMGLATKHRGALQIGPDGKQKKGTTYMPVDTRERTPEEQAQASLMEKQLRKMDQDHVAGEVNIAGQQTQNLILKYQAEAAAAQDPLVRMEAQRKVQALQRIGDPNVPTAQKIQDYVVGMGLTPEAAKAMTYVDKFPHLIDGQLLYEQNPMDERRIVERANQYLPQMLQLLPTDPEGARDVAYAMASGNQKRVEAIINKNSRTAGMIAFQQHQEQMHMQRQQLNLQAANVRVDLTQKLLAENPGLSPEAADQLAKASIAGTKPPAGAEEQYNMSREAAYNLLLEKGKADAARIKDTQFDSLRQTVQGLMSEKAKKGSAFPVADEQKLIALTERMYGMAAEIYGVTLPEDRSSPYAGYFWGVVGGATGLGNVAAAAATDQSPTDKARATLIDQLYATNPIFKALGAQGPYTGVTLKPELMNPLVESVLQGPKNMIKRAEDGIFSVAQSNPAVSMALKQYLEDTAKQKIEQLRLAPDSASQDQLIIELEELKSYLERLKGKQ